MSILKQPFAPARLALPVLLALSAAACAENVSDGLAEAAPQTASAGAVQTVLTTTTRAQPQEAAQQWRWQTVATGLNHPWGLAFLPDGRFLISERSGDLRVVDAQGRISAPVTGLPKIDVGGQGGLLDVALDENFADNGRVYFCFSEPGSGGNSTALAEGILSPEGGRFSQVKTLFSQAPKVRSNRHFGCRIALAPGYIYLGMGDRGSRSEEAQNLGSHIGKIVRLSRNGSVPADNPFVQQSSARGEIWSYGHRNIQGMALDAQGRLWASEHGAQGGDEINLIAAGNNYGWPIIAYGKDYGGGQIGAGVTAQAGMEQPLYYWDPSMAPSGMAFVGSNPYGNDWHGVLLAGSLKIGYVGRLTLDGDKIVHEEEINVGARVRDVRQAPDGFIYIVTDSSNGKLMKLLPR